MIGHRASLKSLLIKLVYRTFHTSLLLFINTALFLIILFLFCFKVSALTTQTVKAINGNKPEFVDIENASKKQGFKVLETFYSESSNNIKGEEIKEFDSNLKFSDFKVALLDLDVQSNYQDADGDKIREAQPFKTKTTYAWQDNEGNEIKEDKAETIIGCGSGYSMPLTLTIKTLVNTYSEKGIPNESDSVELIKSYKIAAKSELCYAKPYATEVVPTNQWVGINPDDSYSWNDPKFILRNPNNGGGYSNDYVPNLGYKINPKESLGKKFPTTGFPGAKFQLVMTGAQTDYEFSIAASPGDKVSIDKKGYITLNDKPTGPVTILAKLIRNNNIIHEYTFNATSIWVIPYYQSVTFEEAEKICGGRNKMLTMKELTNSPRAYDFYNLHSESHRSNGYTRKIGDSVFAEWGWVTKQGYPDSNWRENAIEGAPFLGRYWTNEINKNDSNYGFVIHSHDGFVGVYYFDEDNINHYPSRIANPVCKN